MATHSSAPAIITRGLTKDFGNMRALDKVDLRVPRGEIFGVLGPNGAGKTTMLRMLATLEPITRGTAEIFGVDAAGNRSEEHTSELQSRGHLVCRLLLEKKKTLIRHL